MSSITAISLLFDESSLDTPDNCKKKKKGKKTNKKTEQKTKQQKQTNNNMF